MSEHLDSVVALVREKGIPRVAEWTEKGAEKAIDAAEKWVDEHGSELVAQPEILDVAREGLVGLRGVAPHLGTLAQSQAEAVLRHVFDSGETDRASLELAAAEMTFAELMEAQEANSLEVLQAELADQHAWQELEDALKAIGKDALKAAIPLLLAAL